MKKALIILVVLLALAMLAWKYSGSRSSQLFGELVNHVETRDKVVALTFDDGPMPGRTDRILQLLDEADVRATFFLVGEALRAHTEQGRQIVAAGHEVANHSWSHQRMVLRSPAFVARELEDTDAQIRALGVEGRILFRPPYGKKLVMLPYYLGKTDRITIMWDLEPESYADIAGDPAAITRHVSEGVNPGSIILLHVMFASRQASMDAVPGIISKLHEQGYRFVTVSELLELRQ